MKEKNFPNNNNLESLDELTKEVSQIIESLEKEKNLENSIEDYQKLIKLNKIIEKRFQTNSKNISSETKAKIDKIIKRS
tara:strand:+ start:250 stop:486 length:237 start_codon:yes stop_codon:yes gene_type:complete